MRRWALPLPILLAAAASLLPARASDADEPRPAGSWSLVIENDSIQSDSDRDYTHGTRLSYACPAGSHTGICSLGPALAGALPGRKTANPLLAFEFGQSIFTPTDIHIPDPDRSDRPYAGWLYLGASVIDERNGAGLDRLSLQLGLVGPNAYGRQVQNDWHELIGAHDAVGWHHQLDDEPGFVLTGERKWRLAAPLGNGFSADIIPEAKLALGNVFTYGAIGGMARIGRNIGFDYGPARIEPALTGTDYFNPDYAENGSSFGWYFFLGNENRLVGRNIFLDGNTFRGSRHVPKNLIVADLETGAALVYSDWLRLAYSFTIRTPEFHGQTAGPDEFSAITLTARF